MMLRLTVIGAVLLIALAVIFVGGGLDPADETVASAAAGAPAMGSGGAPVVRRSGQNNQAGAEPAPGGPGSPAAATPAPATAPPDPIGGPFRVTNLAGEEVTEAALIGHPSLIFFGYTHCRDLCPPLAEVGQWLEGLGDDAGDVAVYYVTIDPQRDTAEVMTAFLADFDPRIIGLTGTTPQINGMLEQFRVDHARLPGNDGLDGYALQHPAWVYLHNSDGAFAGRMGFGDPREATLVRLRGLAIANYTPSELDALCDTLKANDREPALATYPASLWRSCAERGFAEAQYGLALMLDEGTILPRDAVEAYIWAVRAGHALSALTARLQEEMRPLEVADAIRRAAHWAPVR